MDKNEIKQGESILDQLPKVVESPEVDVNQLPHQRISEEELKQWYSVTNDYFWPNQY